MKALRVLGWPLILLGLVVLLLAPLYLAVRTADLERESFVAASRWALTRAAELDRERERLTARPLILIGGGLTGVGFILLRMRRRFEE